MSINERTAIYRLKGIAIISIIFAHVCKVDLNYGMINRVVGNIFSSVGSFGVPIFMFISGYLFYKSRKITLKSFFKARITGLFIPWLFWGTLIYFYVYLGKDMSVLAWAKYLVGIGPGIANCTPFYYMAMILVMYLLYFKLKKNVVFISITMVLSFISIMVTSFVRPVYDAFSPFINPLNWTFYFGAGMLISQKSCILKTVYKLKRYSIISGIVLVAIIGYVSFNGENVAYWRWYGLPTFILAFVTLCGVITYSPRKRDILEKLGKFSFAIFLIHSPFASAAEHLKNMIDSVGITVIAPVVVFAVVVTILYIGERASKKLNMEKLYSLALGFR